MMRRVMMAVAFGACALPGAASATTTIGSLGTSGASATNCSPTVALYQSGTDGTVSYVAPSGTSQLTQWQTFAPTGTGGKHLTLLVVRHSTDGYVVTALDPVTLPADGSGAGQVDTFSFPQPPLLLAGDTLALYSPDGPGPMCGAHTTANADSLGVLAGGTSSAPGPLSGPPTVGQTLSAPGISAAANSLLNVSATLTPAQEDVRVSTTTPSGVSPGDQTFITSTVSNAGPTGDPVNFTDIVPSGLAVQGGFSPAGTCTVSGQVVSCALTLAAGATAPVYVLVNTPTPGSYPNAVSVAPGPGIIDPNGANNTAGATLVVTAPPAPTTTTTTLTVPQPCRVPKLAGQTSRFAGQLLKLLDCKVGRAISVHSSRVKKGYVITSKPGSGTYKAGSSIRLEVSSGPAPKKKSKPRRKALRR